MKSSLLLIFILNYISSTCCSAYKCNFTTTKVEQFMRFERDPLDCRVFHICAFNKTYTLSCVKGFYFDTVRNICNYANLVDCGAVVAALNETTSDSNVTVSTNDDTSINETESLRIGEISDIIFNASEEEFEIEYGEDDGEEDGEEEDGGEEEENENGEVEVEIDIDPNDDGVDSNEGGVRQTITIPMHGNTTLEKLLLSTLMTSTVEPTVTIGETSTITTKSLVNSTRPWWLGPTECILGFQHRIPHESNCGKYYECQTNGDKIEYACIYPMQFDEFYYECRPYDQVDCGTRKEAKDLCDYRLSKSTLHSIPCYMYPSCKNLTDGYYPDILRDCRHYFQCQDERTISTNFCPQNSTYGGLKFNYYTKKCDIPMRVSYTCGGFSIPIDIYTDQMVCPMGSMITYFSHPSDCNIYLSCLNGRVSSMECPNGTHFSAKHQKCMDAAQAQCENNSSGDNVTEDQSFEESESEEIDWPTPLAAASNQTITDFNNTSSSFEVISEED